MKKQFKGFYNVSGDLPCNFEVSYIKSKIEGVKDYGVVHIEENPSYGIVFDRAATIWPQSKNTGDFYEPKEDELYLSPMTMEHFAIILVAPYKDINNIYDTILELFSTEEIQQMVKKDADDYNTAHYSIHQANLKNGLSILHFVSFSGILEVLDIKKILEEHNVWHNIKYMLKPNDLFNSYFNYFDNWFLKKTSIEFAKEFYDTFKTHPLFESQEMEIVTKDVLKKINRIK